MLDQIKVAIVCDWLTVYGGAERVIRQIHELFPKAPIFTSIYNKDQCLFFRDAEVKSSYLQKIPGSKNFHRLFLPFMPKVFERMNLNEYDLVISSSHSVAKSVITNPGTLHVSYCHTPMRYVWDEFHQYQNLYQKFSPFKFLYRPMLHRIRMWDRISADRVDHYIANSDFIRRRIHKYYKREASVIHPPVDLNQFKKSDDEREFYLAVGRLVPFKRFDLVVQACDDLDLPLKVVGVGPELKNLKLQASNKVEFLGKIDDESLKKLYQKAKALIFPQVEDFGITPLEAMASGTPVIAYSEGGASETVIDGDTGIFFHEQNLKSLKEAILKMESSRWNRDRISEHAETFSNARFKQELLKNLEIAWVRHQEKLKVPVSFETQTKSQD